MERTFALRDQQNNNPQATLNLEPNSIFQPFNPSTSLNDPIAYIAQLAGYSDSERWWEVTFEQAANETSVFAVVLE